MNTVTVNIQGEELQITGTYEQGDAGSYWQPPEPAYFEIEKVEYKEVDITDLLESLAIDFDELEEKAREQWEQDYCII